MLDVFGVIIERGENNLGNLQNKIHQPIEVIHTWTILLRRLQIQNVSRLT